MNQLKANNLSKSVKGRSILRGVSFDVEKGSILGLLGPSGSGKTTLLRIIAGLERSDSGEVILNGTVVAGKNKFTPPEKRDVGLVFQDFALWPHMNVEEHIRFVLKAKKRDTPDELKKILKILSLEPVSKNYPQTLSGGEKQRLALARSLAQNPKVLLLDEPMSNLDKILRHSLKKEISTLKELGMTIIYTTHDIEDIKDIADSLLILESGQIVQQGKIEKVLAKPKNELIRSIIGTPIETLINN